MDIKGKKFVVVGGAGLIGSHTVDTLLKDDVKEVNRGYECGLNIKNFNDIKVGDIVEAYEQVEVKRKL